MSTLYSQVGYGSKGETVKKLQQLLNQGGYNLDVDGSFGPKTLEAVKSYQKNNNLAVDGIVGNNTWNALTTMSTSESSSDSAADTTTGDAAPEAPTVDTTAPADTGFNYGDYQESDVVKQAQQMLQEHMASQPGNYQSAYADQINAILDKILNRDKFSYDLNGDALYQQYKDKYIQQGKMAMMDTMGQAQAMTGGYGNSYAQSVGQQAYQAHLNNLNDIVPELYQMALNQYNQEGQDMYNQYGLLASQDEQDYGRHRDTVSDYYTELDRLMSQYNTERDYDYSKWADERDFAYGEYSDDRAYEYQEGRDQVKDDQWQAEFDEAVRQFNHANGISSGGSDSTGSTNNGGNGNNGGQGYDNSSDIGVNDYGIRVLQQALGVTPDGKWGPASQAAAQARWGTSSLDGAYTAYMKEYEQSKNQPNGSNGFSGKTYSEAVAYMKNNGVPSVNAASVMTEWEWEKRKNANSSTAAVANYNSYGEYLADYVAYCIETYG